MITSHRVGKLSWSPKIPGDKSITHRAFLMSTLCTGTYSVRGWNRGEDCGNTLKAVEALGVSVNRQADRIVLTGSGGHLTPPPGALDLGNSGTGLRLLLGILAGQDFEVSLTGDSSLKTRPMRRVLDPLEKMGVRTWGDTPPVRIQGGELSPLEYVLPLASAQVKSALLLAGVQAAGTTIIRGPVRTRDHTERMLSYFGAELSVADSEIQVMGKARLLARDLQIPGDPSAAAFYMALPGIVPGSRVEIMDMCLNPGRIGFLSCLERMGMSISIVEQEEAMEPRGSVRISGAAKIPLQVSPDEVPGIIDELPILVMLSAFAAGESTFTGLAELKHKESNRLEAMQEGLSGLGAEIRSTSDTWEVKGTGGRPLPGGRVHSRGDHRVGMALLMGGLGCVGGVQIVDSAGIETSDPHFCENLDHIQEMGA